MSGEKIYILGKDIDSKKNEIKSEKKFGLFFWVTLIQAVVSKTLRLLNKNIFLFTNKKISL